MKSWVIALALCLAAAAAVWASEVVVRPARAALSPMLPDLHVTLLTPAAGGTTEVRAMRLEGKVESRSGRVTAARVEIGVLGEGEPQALKTITVPVGANFTTWVQLPGDGPYTVYAAAIQVISQARSADVRVRPMEGRDLSVGASESVLIPLTDARGRRLDGRVTVYQGATIIGERWTVEGRAVLHDLPAGEYTVRATCLSGVTETRTLRLPGGPRITYVINFATVGV